MLKGFQVIRRAIVEGRTSKPTRHTGNAVSRPFLDYGFRRNDQEGCIVRGDLLGMIARQKVLLRSERPVTDQAGAVRIYGAGHPMIGTVLMLFFGLPSITRSLYAT